MKTPKTIATDLLAIGKATGHDEDEVVDAFVSYTEGPFRPSDYSSDLNNALRLVTPANAEAVEAALSEATR